MVVLKHNGAVYIAASQCYQDDAEAIRTGKVNPENLKAYHPQGRKNQLIAAYGTNCVTEAVRYQRVFPKTLNMQTLVFEVFPILCHISKFFDKSEDGYSANDMIFAKDKEAYVLYRDGTCLEVEGVFSDGINSDIAISLYDAETIEDPVDFFRKVFVTQEELYGKKLFPVAMLNTLNNKIKVINREK
ncbi:MAG: hypothetical protein IKA02_04530 [Clostridia bacterium]|nr:hypothetical protein [Clostridia bacterium]